MNKRIIPSILAAFLICFAAGAQALTSSYFLDNSLWKNRMNPAFAPRSNYFGLPSLSNTGVGVYGNFGPADFLYPKNGELYTFLNSNVSAEEFAKRLSKYPGADIDFDSDILNFGFFTSDKNFWSFDLGIRTTAAIGVPRDFFMLMKQGMYGDRTTYTLDGFNTDANASIYASFGHSRDLSDYVKGLKVGVKFRFFVSMAQIGLDLGKSTIEMTEDNWTINADATGTIASSFLKVVPAAEPGAAPEIITDFNNIAPAGYGFSFDLGAEYRLSIGSILDGMTFSFSALDLGAFFYKAKNVQNLKSDGNVHYAGLEDFNINKSLDFTQIFEEIKDDFLAIADFKETNPTNFRRSTYPKIYAGVEMPFVRDIMSVGLLYSGKFGRQRTINELTLSYNLNPCKWFNLGLSWSFLNSWKTLGWIVEFSPKAGVDFFVGSDYTFFEVMPTYFLPVDKAWLNARFGLTFTIGSKYRK